jgi:hypothetical protein
VRNSINPLRDFDVLARPPEPLSLETSLVRVSPANAKIPLRLSEEVLEELDS